MFQEMIRLVHAIRAAIFFVFMRFLLSHLIYFLRKLGLVFPFFFVTSVNDKGKKVQIDGVTRQNGEPGHGQATQPSTSERLRSSLKNER